MLVALLMLQCGGSTWWKDILWAWRKRKFGVERQRVQYWWVLECFFMEPFCIYVMSFSFPRSILAGPSTSFVTHPPLFCVKGNEWLHYCAIMHLIPPACTNPQLGIFPLPKGKCFLLFIIKKRECWEFQLLQKWHRKQLPWTTEAQEK